MNARQAAKKWKNKYTELHELYDPKKEIPHIRGVSQLDIRRLQWEATFTSEDFRIYNMGLGGDVSAYIDSIVENIVADNLSISWEIDTVTHEYILHVEMYIGVKEDGHGDTLHNDSNGN